MRGGLLSQQFGLLTRGIEAEQRNKRRFATVLVFANSFAEPISRTLCVEEIIGDLKRETKIVGERVKSAALLVIGFPQNRAGLTRKGYERAGFELLKAGDLADIDLLMLGQNVDHLPPDHAVAAGGAGQRNDQFGPDAGMMTGLFVAKNFERMGEQPVASKHCGRFVELDMG